MSARREWSETCEAFEDLRVLCNSHGIRMNDADFHTLYTHPAGVASETFGNTVMMMRAVLDTRILGLLGSEPVGHETRKRTPSFVKFSLNKPQGGSDMGDGSIREQVGSVGPSPYIKWCRVYLRRGGDI